MLKRYDIFKMIGNNYEQQKKLNELFKLFFENKKIYGLFFSGNIMVSSFRYVDEILKYQKRLVGFNNLFFIDEKMDEYQYFVITDIY